jgi:hypothetical protein
MSFLNTVKQWFQTGDFPTEAQFAQLFDYLRFKDQKVAVADVDGLVDLINGNEPLIKITATGAAIPQTIPVGYAMECIYITAPTACTPSVRNAAGAAGDIIPAADTGETVHVFGIMIFRPAAALSILVEDVPAGSQVIFQRRKIL